jgi:hypothetical protein
MERKRNRSTIYIARTSLRSCLLGLLSSHSLAQNDCGHISNIRADHVHRGKGWMLCVDAVVIADGENPLSVDPDQVSQPFSLTKPVWLPTSLAHCRDVGSCHLPPPSSKLATSRHPSGTTSFTTGLHHCPSCPHRSMWIFLYFFAPHVPLLASTIFVMSLCLIN